MDSANNSVQLRNVSKAYTVGGRSLFAVNNVELEINAGEYIAIHGPSGSGKTTLLNIIGLMDRPSNGTVLLEGQRTELLNNAERARLRGMRIGFMFQAFNLLPRLTILDNVLLPTIYTESGVDRRRDARAALARLGLEGRASHRPNELSGGERQRAALARALINEPGIILADEPTGNLDSKAAGDVIKLLEEQNEQGRTVIVITHNPQIAKRAKRAICVKDGQVI